MSMLLNSIGVDSSQAPLTIFDLTVTYNKKPVLWDLHLQVPEGGVVGIIGPNGAGKSTLLKVIMDIVPRAAGTIHIYGRPYRRQRRLVSYVPQRESVDWNYPITVLDLVTMGLYRHIGWCRPIRPRHHERALSALEQVGMQDFADRQIGQLSGGQQQRIFLARALVQDTRIVFMDEPFVGIDAKTEQAIVDVLRQLRMEHKTVFVVHHDLRTVNVYFDYLVMLNSTIIASGPTGEVFGPDNLYSTYGGKLALIEGLDMAGVGVQHG